MSNTTFTATPSNVNPSTAQGIFPSWATNQIDSSYASQYNRETQSYLRSVIANTIINSIPAQYPMLKLLFDKPPRVEMDFEYSWYEREIPRPALTIGANSTGGATSTITLTTGGSSGVSINDSVILPDERVAIVTAVSTTANTITVKPQNGEPNIPNYTAGETILIGYPVYADGQNFFSNYTRMDLKKNTNWATRGLRAKRWTTETAIRVKNLQLINYFEEDAAELMENVYNDMFYLFMNANKGEYDVTVPVGGSNLLGTAYHQKVGDGIYPFLVKNGAAHSTSTLASLEADFKTLAFGTNFKNVDDVRYVLGTPRTLHYMSEVWKDPKQYAPSDTISSLDLREYRFGDMRYVPVPIVHWEAQYNQFQPAWENRMLVLDKSNIDTVVVNGFEQIFANNTAAMTMKMGGYNDYIDYFVHFCLGTRVTTVKGNFWMDLIGV